MTQATTPPTHLAQAEQLDRLITARQAGLDATPATEVSPPITALVDALVELAATTTPPPEFVADLAAQLERRYPYQSTPAWFPGIVERLLQWDRPVRRLAFAAITSLLLLIGFLIAPPTARARLWDWLAGFSLIPEAQVTGNTILLEAPVTPTDAPAPMTLAEIEQQVSFPVQLPTWLPNGLRFTGGFVDTSASGMQITLAYHTAAAPADGYPAAAPLLLVVISDGPLPNRPLLAEGYQQSVRIGSVTGLYSHGNWRSQTPVGDKAAATGPLIWDSTLDDAWLTWQASQRHYLLYAQGLGFGVDEMVQVAVSMGE